MSKYSAEVPKSAESFQYGGVAYAAGDRFESDDPCQILGFAQAAKLKNPNTGKSNGTPNFWQNMAAACPAGPSTAPVAAPAIPPVEADARATGGDSAKDQGAPETPSENTEGGTKLQDPPTDPPPPPGEEDRRPPEGEVSPPLSTEQPQVQTNAGDPVDLFSGTFYLDETDLEVPNAIIPLSFTRSYRSGTPSFGPFGWSWDHNYNLYLRELNDGNISLWRRLHEDIFRFNGATFDPPRGVFEKLERLAGLGQTYEVTGEGGTVMRFERPPGWVDGERIPITRLEDRHGNALRFTYGAVDRLAEVRDNDERFLHFEYDACGLLVMVSDHAGRKYVYAHDEQTAHLVCVTSPATTDHPRGISRVYYYADPFALPELRHNIVRVEDSAGNVYIENAYDEDPASLGFARVTEQRYGEYLFQFRITELQWVPADPLYMNIPSVQVEVMNPDFGLETYTFNYRGDLLDRRFRLNKDRSFRVVAVQYEFDVEGNLAITTRPDGSQEINTYDTGNADPRMRGKLLKKELTAAAGFPAPSRIVWRGGYESTYQLLVEEKNERNAVTRYQYDFDVTPVALNNTGKLKRILHPNATLPDATVQSSRTTFEHNSKGQVTAVVLPDGTRQEMAYGAAGAARSRLATHTFDPVGLNIVNRIEYDAFGFDSTTIDGNGNVTTKSINALGQLERETLPAVNGVTAEYALHYNPDRRLAAFERPRGEYQDAVLAGDFVVDTFDRNVLGYPTVCHLSSNTVEARTLRTCCDFRGFPLRTVNPDGSRVDRVYDERGLLIEEAVQGTDGSRISRRNIYDRTGNLTQEIEANGRVTRYGHDGFGRVTKVTSSNGTEVRYAWGLGDVVDSVEMVGDDGFGAVRRLSQMSYSDDEKSRRTAETVQSFVDNPAAAVAVTTTYFYDTSDRVERMVDNRGGVVSSQYDGVGRLVAWIDALGNEDHYAYDKNGNVVQTDSHQIEPDGSVSIITKRHTYDARNRPISIVEPDGSSITLEHDARDLAVRQTDHLGLVGTVTYDSLGNRVAETYDTAGLAIAHRWTLDQVSRATSYIDPTGQVSTCDFDGIGRVVKTQYPNGTSSARRYNSAGDVAEERLTSGIRFEYGYDAAKRLTSTKNSTTVAPIGALPDHSFKYDGLDRLVSAKVGADEVLRKYDSRGRLASEETLGSRMTCIYDDVTGDIVKTWPDGRAEKYTRDLNGITTRIEELTHGALGSGGAVIADLVPSGAAYFGEARYQGQLKASAKYDDRKRLVELSWSSPAGIDERARYRYDRANRDRVEALTGQNPKFQYFEFDTNHRLSVSKDGFAFAVADAVTQGDHDGSVGAANAASAAATHVEEFDYDAADARLKYAETGQADRIYGYLSGHRILTDGVSAFAHSNDGVLLTDGQLTYEADALGRIVAIKAGAVLVCRIDYDAIGRPSAVREQGKPTRTFNYLGEFVEQENDNGAPVRQPTRHPATGVPIAYHVNAATRYTLFDRRYNLVGLTDASGALLETYRYKPFGVASVFDAAGAIVPSSQFGVEPVFGGQRFLASCGLYLSKRRLMNPVHGLFLSPDPRGYANSASLYVYAAQNPIDLIDPDGEIAFLAIFVVMAVGALVAGGINAVRQGIQIAEDPAKAKEGFSWTELGMSMGIGAIAAPVLVVAPELAIPLAAYGVVGGVNEMRHGNWATGAFDIVTSVVPFGFKGVRSATGGRGTVINQVRGLGPSAPWATRTGRFTLIEKNMRNFLPSPFGKRVGLGFARTLAGGPEGHTSVIIEREGGGFWFVEKNIGRQPDLAGFRPAESPLEFYMQRTRQRPFEYDSMRVARSSNKEAMNYAQDRVNISELNPEPFDARCANCSHFAADVLAKAGFRGMGKNGKASGLFSDFTNFNTAKSMSYSAPFWVKLPAAPTLSK